MQKKIGLLKKKTGLITTIILGKGERRMRGKVVSKEDPGTCEVVRR